MLSSFLEKTGLLKCHGNCLYIYRLNLSNTPRRQSSPRNWNPDKTHRTNHGISWQVKGNQWVFIVPDHKAGYFLGGVALGGFPLDSHDIRKGVVVSVFHPKAVDSA